MRRKGREEVTEKLYEHIGRLYVALAGETMQRQEAEAALATARRLQADAENAVSASPPEKAKRGR